MTIDESVLDAVLKLTMGEDQAAVLRKLYNAMSDVKEQGYQEGWAKGYADAEEDYELNADDDGLETWATPCVVYGLADEEAAYQAQEALYTETVEGFGVPVTPMIRDGLKEAHGLTEAQRFHGERVAARQAQNAA